MKAVIRTRRRRHTPIETIIPPLIIQVMFLITPRQLLRRYLLIPTLPELVLELELELVVSVVLLLLVLIRLTSRRPFLSRRLRRGQPRARPCKSVRPQVSVPAPVPIQFMRRWRSRRLPQLQLQRQLQYRYQQLQARVLRIRQLLPITATCAVTATARARASGSSSTIQQLPRLPVWHRRRHRSRTTAGTTSTPVATAGGRTPGPSTL